MSVPLDQVYQAAVTVIKNNGVVLTEYIPHDSTNTVRALSGKVNERNVWVRVEAVDPRNHPAHHPSPLQLGRQRRGPGLRTGDGSRAAIVAVICISSRICWQVPDCRLVSVCKTPVKTGVFVWLAEV